MTSDRGTFDITFWFDEVRAALRCLSDQVSDLRLVRATVAVTQVGKADMFRFDPEVQVDVPPGWFPEGRAAEPFDLVETAWAVKR